MSTVTSTRGGRTPVRYPPHLRQSPRCTAARHGTYVAYQRGCSCPRAREAWRLYAKRRRQGRAVPLIVDATGTRRRLRALAAIGWPNRLLATHLGYAGPDAVQQLTTRDRVNVRTAAAVRELYDRLSMTPGPSPRTRSRAERAGWAPPLAWDDQDLDNPTATPAGADLERDTDVYDHVAVELAVNGRLPVGVPLGPAERDEALRRLHAAGLNDAQAGRRLGLTGNAVQHIRTRLGLPANAGRCRR